MDIFTMPSPSAMKHLLETPIERPLKVENLKHEFHEDIAGCDYQSSLSMGPPMHCRRLSIDRVPLASSFTSSSCSSPATPIVRWDTFPFYKRSQAGLAVKSERCTIREERPPLQSWKPNMSQSTNNDFASQYAQYINQGSWPNSALSQQGQPIPDGSSYPLPVEPPYDHQPQYYRPLYQQPAYNPRPAFVNVNVHQTYPPAGYWPHSASYPPGSAYASYGQPHVEQYYNRQHLENASRYGHSTRHLPSPHASPSMYRTLPQQQQSLVPQRTYNPAELVTPQSMQQTYGISGGPGWSSGSCAQQEFPIRPTRDSFGLTDSSPSDLGSFASGLGLLHETPSRPYRHGSGDVARPQAGPIATQASYDIFRPQDNERRSGDLSQDHAALGGSAMDFEREVFDDGFPQASHLPSDDHVLKTEPDLPSSPPILRTQVIVHRSATNAQDYPPGSAQEALSKIHRTTMSATTNAQRLQQKKRRRQARESPTPATKRAKGPRSRRSNKATSRTGSVGPWSVEEEDTAISIMRRIKTTAFEGTIEDLWHEISETMATDHGLHRTPAAIKNQWNRFLRSKSGFDERVRPRPDAMRTGIVRKPALKKASQPTQFVMQTSTIANDRPRRVTQARPTQPPSPDDTISATGSDRILPHDSSDSEFFDELNNHSQ